MQFIWFSKNKIVTQAQASSPLLTNLHLISVTSFKISNKTQILHFFILLKNFVFKFIICLDVLFIRCITFNGYQTFSWVSTKPSKWVHKNRFTIDFKVLFHYRDKDVLLKIIQLNLKMFWKFSFTKVVKITFKIFSNMSNEMLMMFMIKFSNDAIPQVSTH
jgi:hypothetical protein